MPTKILTAQQMREADRISIEQLGLAGVVLMENAGRGVVEVLERTVPDLSAQRIGILCGNGNNGGDGFVVARHLLMRGVRPRVVLLAEKVGTTMYSAKRGRNVRQALSSPHHQLWMAGSCSGSPSSRSATPGQKAVRPGLSSQPAPGALADRKSVV